MEYSHIVSELVLASACFFVFFKYLLNLEFSATVLWESFVLSIAAAALFGALKFAGIKDAIDLNDMFQNIASTVGSISLVAASWFLINDRNISYKQAIIVLFLGLILLILGENNSSRYYVLQIPKIAMIIVALIGIYGLIKGKIMAGSYLLIGVLFFALAFLAQTKLEDEDQKIDVFHYLLAFGVIFFGLAASKHKYKYV